MKEELSVVGKGVPKVDGILKATGKAVYGADFSLPGMLYGKVLRSTVPHAKILNIDTGKALKLPGVRAIITGKDFPWGLKYGFTAITRDQTPLAQDKVRYIGDEVAAVAAIDEDIAEEALDLIKVEYEELPAVFDPFEAMKEGAPQLHDHVENNISAQHHSAFGDVEKGFRESDLVREDEFTTQAIKHGFLEPHASVALWDPSGKATLWANKQSPYIVYRKLAMALGLQLSKVRVIQTYVGAGFGSARSDPFALDFCSIVLSKKTGKPVKFVYSMEDVLVMGEMRHPYYLRAKTGITKDGYLKAIQVYAVADGGAYSTIGPVSIALPGFFIDIPYRISNIKYDGYRAFTNKGFCGSLRGHCIAQMRWAIGQHLDMVCNDLGLDIAEVSKKNALQPGDKTAGGYEITSCAFTECVEKASEASGWKEKKGKLPPFRGIGMGTSSFITGVKLSGHNSASCVVKMNEDGTASVITGATDIGQGSCTIISQIVAEVLGLSIEDIIINSGVDTDFTPIDPGTYGSRVSFYSGNAAKIAAEDAKQQLAKIAGKVFEISADEVVFKDRKVFPKGSPDLAWKIDKLIRYVQHRLGKENKSIIGRGSYDSGIDFIDFKTGKGNISATYTFAADVVELEVDPDTGKVTILNAVGAHDIGRALNPILCAGQLDGAWIQATGQIFFEDLVRDNKDGHVLNPSFLDYKMPTSMDIPLKNKHIFVESIDPDGPFGAKEVGEGASVAIFPAIGNAIFDAIGVRIPDLPITPEKVLKAIKKKRKGSGKTNSLA
ncbi:MAG: molybdopterin-dependent oxidoreductase [Proteobacteria bacterium]|jgi:4-hydroxybenzoyl-CoA reductase subunit alpha|nr:molybdopterin-dependent oxidoreductase [Pseudomonadota bacterium]